MSSTVWGKFYWSDYASDEALKMCSLSAQGLWMRMLCTMAGSEPYGYLTINGHTLNNADLVKLYAVGHAEVDDAVAELTRYGVFSRDANQRIYSRRMVRDFKKAAVAKKNGKRGGNPNLSKQRDIPLSDNREDKGKDKPHIPDTKCSEDTKDTKRERLNRMEADLRDAAGACLSDQSFALSDLTRPLAWVASGCDWELDVLPTVKTVSARAGPKSIRGWKYFEPAVADAKANRLKPMPEGRTDERTHRKTPDAAARENHLAGILQAVAGARGT